MSEVRKLINSRIENLKKLEKYLSNYRHETLVCSGLVATAIMDLQTTVLVNYDNIVMDEAPTKPMQVAVIDGIAIYLNPLMKFNDTIISTFDGKFKDDISDSVDIEILI